MEYAHMERAMFLSRPNRFVARIETAAGVCDCHVKNTGRCRELLLSNAEIWVQRQAGPNRKTAYDLIAVRKGTRLINMDANAPNRVFAEWAAAGGFLPGVTLLKAEVTHGDSRFDFYLETAEKRVFVEIKGVTLEENGVVRFPDAPTQRGVKHLNGLAACVAEGYEAWVVFVVQMEGVRYLEANRATHPAFADALLHAHEAGVHVLAMDCRVTETSLDIRQPVEVRLG